MSVHALGDQLVVIAEFQRHRPVLSKIRVRTPEQPEAIDRKTCANPDTSFGKRVVSESKQPRRQIQYRQQNLPHNNQQDEDPVLEVGLADLLGHRSRPGPVEDADGEVGQQACEKEEMRQFKMHTNTRTQKRC